MIIRIKKEDITVEQDLVIKNLKYLIDTDELNQTAIALMFGEKQNTNTNTTPNPK